MSSREMMRSGLRRALPGTKILKHYIQPFMRRGQPQIPYDGKQFFDAYFSCGLSDRITIDPQHDIVAVRYHYNAVENSIIDGLLRLNKMPLNGKVSVLDIGSGAGHWIDFYLKVFEASEVVGVEIADPAVAGLRAKYQSSNAVRIVQDDISQATFELNQTFDLINAIGVMFHITDDHLWQRAVRNLVKHLNKDGVIIVGGQFGWITQNVQVRPDETGQVLLVNKRIRSLRYWRRCARQAGSKVAGIQRTNQGLVNTPENHVLFLELMDTAHKRIAP